MEQELKDIFAVSQKAIAARIRAHQATIPEEVNKTYADYYNEWVALRTRKNSVTNPQFMQEQTNGK